MAAGTGTETFAALRFTFDNWRWGGTPFYVRTGKRMWTFHTVPKKGEFGYETWLNNSADVNGNTGVWTQVSVDEDLGLAYLAVESPTSDFFGGKRPGPNLFGNSLVAVDLKTGERRWHFQLIHHEIWDLDNSSAPLLMDVTVDGKPRKVVGLPSKQGFFYVFDRATGQPVWPIKETKVAKGNVPGEWYSPTQPIPSKPPVYARNGVEEKDRDQMIRSVRSTVIRLHRRLGGLGGDESQAIAQAGLAGIEAGNAAGVLR